MTGIPVGTDTNDLSGQFAVLQLKPFDNKDFFSKFLKSAHWYCMGAPHLLLYVLRRCMVRHTKGQVSTAN